MSEARTFVLVQTSFEGLHRWTDAPEQEHYLRSWHRHLFVVGVKVQVAHDDRKIEINAFKRWLDAEIGVLYRSMEGELTNIGSRSCETIAGSLVTSVHLAYGRWRDVECAVLEDGLLGALVVCPGLSSGPVLGSEGGYSETL